MESVPLTFGLPLLLLPSGFPSITVSSKEPALSWRIQSLRCSLLRGAPETLADVWALVSQPLQFDSTALGVSCSDSVTRSLALMPVTHPTQQARFTMPVLWVLQWVLPVLRSPQHESAPPGLLLLSKKRQYYSATSNVSINFKELTATP